MPRGDAQGDRIRTHHRELTSTDGRLSQIPGKQFSRFACRLPDVDDLPLFSEAAPLHDEYLHDAAQHDQSDDKADQQLDHREAATTAAGEGESSRTH